ncbi:MAG: UDP-N-acetylmuramoyl-tripeptide--D-alanyl-D-alanine ligase [Chloroflexota bacterium]|nr:UDP-N-acetylmuramoyl-tripeptide--D-alanyl-D-alanine ligase [Chloroflexota bacterium]
MITAKELATALRPALVRAPSVGPMRFQHAVVDSRKAHRGDIFVALKGERADGHDFVKEASQRGATAAIVEREVEAEIAQYVVPDALAALQDLARNRRAARPKLKVIAVTGSVGKTTTKELVAAVLSTRYALLKNEGNLNSEIGLPVVLLELTRKHQRAVLEMGMWARGEIAFLCDIAAPEIGIVTNVGPSHMERLGTIEDIADAKAELVEALPEEGVAILNADDPRVAAMSERTRANVLTYGLTEEADVRAEDIGTHGLSGVNFTLVHGDEREPVYSRLPGRAMVHNALAAAAAGIVDSLELPEIASALSEAQVPTRLTSHRGVNGSTLLDDTYNASPASMSAALELLGEVPGRKIAVLGDMRELGAAELEGHREVGRVAAGVADLIFAVGELGRWIGDAAIQAGHGGVQIMMDKSDVAAALLPELQPGDVVLLKASRALALESLLDDLEERP